MITELEWMQNFGDNLKDILKEWGMSQKELSKESGLSEKTISRCVRGEFMPSVKTLINIGHALDCDVEDLIDFHERID